MICTGITLIGSQRFRNSPVPPGTTYGVAYQATEMAIRDLTRVIAHPTEAALDKFLEKHGFKAESRWNVKHGWTDREYSLKLDDKGELAATSPTGVRYAAAAVEEWKKAWARYTPQLKPREDIKRVCDALSCEIDGVTIVEGSVESGCRCRYVIGTGKDPTTLVSVCQALASVCLGYEHAQRIGIESPPDRKDARFDIICVVARDVRHAPFTLEEFDAGN